MMRISEVIELIESFFDRCNSNSQKSSGDRNAPSSEDTSLERAKCVGNDVFERKNFDFFVIYV